MDPADPGKYSLSSRQTARRLIDSRQPEQRELDARARAVAVACSALNRELSRWVGADGCHAVFMRAITQARPESAALDKIQLRPGTDPYVDGVEESIRSYGDLAAADALQSVLVNVIELLGRLVGDSMATKLIERSIAPPPHSDAKFNDRREQHVKDDTRAVIRRLRSGGQGLGTGLGGGLPGESFKLIAGGPGSGKRILAHRILFGNATSWRPCLCFPG